MFFVVFYWPDQSSHPFCPRRISVQSQVAGTNGEAPTSVGVSFCLGRLIVTYADDLVTFQSV
jgi:hypothetical protein